MKEIQTMEPNLGGIMICQFNHKNFSRKSYQKLPRMDEKFGSPISAMTELLSASSCKRYVVQGDQDHFFTKEMLISLSILKLQKNP